jgi:hypothetical protein
LVTIMLSGIVNSMNTKEYILLKIVKIFEILNILFSLIRSLKNFREATCRRVFFKKKQKMRRRAIHDLS